MSVAEYTAAFISIMIGLSLADLAASLQRLLRAGSRVKWDALAPLAALLTTAFVMNVWWSSYSRLAALDRLSIGAFIPDLIALILLYSLASSALPDEVKEERLVLADYYEANRSSFWRLFALYTFWVTAVVAVRLIPSGAGAARILPQILPNLFLTALMLLLSWTGRRSVHLGIIILLLVITGLAWLPQEVAGGARPAVSPAGAAQPRS